MRERQKDSREEGLVDWDNIELRRHLWKVLRRTAEPLKLCDLCMANLRDYFWFAPLILPSDFWRKVARVLEMPATPEKTDTIIAILKEAHLKLPLRRGSISSLKLPSVTPTVPWR